MKISSRSQKLHYIFHSVFRRGECGAILTAEGTPLHVQHRQVGDIGTLPFAGRITQQYLQLKPGQIAVMNDPYSGGALLSTITLLMGVCISEKSSGKTDLVLCYRFPLRPKLIFCKTVDQEGLRIPPTPIADETTVNRQLLDAMKEHPESPDELVEKTLVAVTRMRELKVFLTEALQIHKVQLTKAAIQEYLLDSENIMRNLLSEFPLGEMTSNIELSDGSRMRLRLESVGQNIMADFTGTTNSAQLAMTETSVFGACFSALCVALDHLIPVNAGTFKALQVTAPSGSLLNARYPSSTFFGFTEGLGITANFVLNALLKLMGNKKGALSYPNLCHLDIQFKNRQHFYDTLAGGTGASVKGKGEDGLDFWTRSLLQPSVEDIETRFPLRILSIGPRSNSGGKGKERGGDGLIKVFELLAPAQVRWLAGHTRVSDHPDTSHMGQGPDISFTSGTGEKLKAGPSGEIELQAGDKITLMSGGGYGI